MNNLKNSIKKAKLREWQTWILDTPDVGEQASSVNSSPESEEINELARIMSTHTCSIELDDTSGIAMDLQMKTCIHNIIIMNSQRKHNNVKVESIATVIRIYMI